MDYSEKPDLAELAHFGVKGMRWGQRKAQDTSGSGGGNAASPPKSNRQMNKEFRSKENEKRNTEIDAARQRYKTSARDNYLNAKAQYKADKKTMGTAAARAKFDEVKNKNVEDYYVAQQAKSGKEVAQSLLVSVGTIAVLALVGGSAGALARR